MPTKALHILVAEDNDDEALIFEVTLRRLAVCTSHRRVRNGREVIAYLCREPPFDDPIQYPFPRLLMLDLNMPDLSGFEVLGWLKEHPQCAVLPTHVFSTSMRPDDVARAYQSGANSYFTKPLALDEFTEMLRTICHFWHLAEWPEPPPNRRCTPQPIFPSQSTQK